MDIGGSDKITTDFTLYLICLCAEFLVVLVRVSSFNGHIFIFFL